jgi:hypothetical protein
VRRPMPLVAPVTMVILPSSLPIRVSLSVYFRPALMFLSPDRGRG